MQYISVERIADLKKEEWRFWFDERRCALVLDQYVEYRRETTRHKFLVSERYDHINRHATTITDPPLPESVIEDARRLFMDKLTVIKG